MNRLSMFFVISLMVPGAAMAHGGGLDKCGGHNDKQQGGYHVHDHARYCACNPQSENCTTKEGRERKPEQKDKSALPPSKQ